MKLKTSVIFLLLAILSPALLHAEGNRDSLALVTAEWNEEQLNGKVTFKQAFFKGNLFESNQIVSIIEIKGAKKKRNSPHFAFAAEEELTRTSEMAVKHDALAAVNGNFFSFKKPHNSVDYLKINGVEICGNNDGHSQRSFNQTGVMVINRKGRIAILKPDSTDKEWERKLDAPDIMTAGPLLMISGEKEPLKESSFYTTRHPRTAVAILDNGNVLLVTVDGRNAMAQGMSLEELQNMLGWLGAEDLINLDGGGSTTMYIKGKEVVNHPSDNKKLDHLGERKVANSLLLLFTE